MEFVALFSATVIASAIANAATTPRRKSEEGRKGLTDFVD